MWFLFHMIVAVLDQDLSKQLIAASAADSYRYAVTAAVILLATIPNALFIGFTGSSLGKWIFGIRAVTLDGAPMGFKTALWRELQVFVRGWGLGIPLVVFITTLIARATLKAEGSTSWDRELQIQIFQRPASPKQAALGVFGVVVWMVIYVLILSLAYV